MKIFLYIFILLLCFSCATKESYWCGDHACVSKSEKEAYFKKTMTVEIKNNTKSKDKTDITNIEKIINSQKKNTKEEKYLSKQAKIERKRNIKEEKRLAKQEKIKSKKLVKEMKSREKELSKKKTETRNLIKQKKVEAESKNKNVKEIEKNKKILKKIEKSTEIASKYIEFSLSDFDKIVKKIRNKNNFKDFPDINDVPN